MPQPAQQTTPSATLGQRLQEIRTGFERPFWVANISEIFERLSYYAAFAVLARYLNEALQFPAEKATSLTGIFGGAVWVMAILGGALADRIGFRRALSSAYLILTVAYFLMSSIGAPWMAPARHLLPLAWVAGIILFLPALGIALVKPSVVGTTARASKENVRSIGYSIYYTLVNIGSTAGPLLAGYITGGTPPRMQSEAVFRLAAVSVFLMLIAVLLFFKEPRRAEEKEATSLAEVGRNFLTVITNKRFVVFLLIFSGYWIVFWQQYLILTIYIHKYVNPSANTPWILATDPIIVISLTVAVNALTRNIPSFRAIILGTFLTAVGWIVIALHASAWAAVVTLVIVAFGEIIQSPRYYEYISRLAPPGQQGTYMGFAFLPIGIGSIVGGIVGGALLHHFADVAHHPAHVWFAISGIGLVTAVLLWIYDGIVKPSAQASA